MLSAVGTASSRMLLGGAFYACKGCNQVYFIDLKALHEAHTLIFVIACIHITYSCFVMFISSGRMKNWLQWEDIGRDSQGIITDKKDVERVMKGMRMPSDHHGHMKTFMCACGEQVRVIIECMFLVVVGRWCDVVEGRMAGAGGWGESFRLFLFVCKFTVCQVYVRIF